MPDRYDVLGVGVSAVDLDAAVTRIACAVREGETGYVCVTGVHGVMEAQTDPGLCRIHNESLLTVPDGLPLVWIARRRGVPGVGRVYGPDLMRRVLSALGPRPSDLGPSPPDLGPRTSDLDPARPDWVSHFLLGSTPQVLERLATSLDREIPGVRIAGTWAPPFRDLTDDEWGEALRRVRESGAAIVWIGLSTPKQERFMAEFARRWAAEERGPRSEVRDPRSESGPSFAEAAEGEERKTGVGSREGGTGRKQPSDLGHPTSAFGPRTSDLGSRSSVLLVGVGAAFDVLAGMRRDAPRWMKRAGLQWLHRLAQEPRRLGPRYLRIVPGFLWRALPDLLFGKRSE